MAKRIKTTKSKYSESYSIIDDYVDPVSKKRTTFVVEPLGSLKKLMEKYNVTSKEEVMEKLNIHLKQLRELDNEENATVTISLSPTKQIDDDSTRKFNIGYLYLYNILASLGIKDIFSEISKSYHYQYNINDIFNDLVCGRVIFPGSKRATYHQAFHLLETPNYALEDVYRSLQVLNDNRYLIESRLYNNSKSIHERNTSILYYDCTNFYFELEEEKEICKYGKSKENRPNPIVQYGLFIDADGLPIADYIFDGNKNEQYSLRELEKQIEADFGLSKFIVCADAGLNGWENKIYNDKKRNGAYIVTQPIKKLKKSLKEWALDPSGWRILNHNETYNISELSDTIEINGNTYKTSDITFYKDRWIKETKHSNLTNKKEVLEEHLIVSFNTKYKNYQKKIRDKKIECAQKMVNNPSNIKTNNQRDPRYYLKEYSTTKNGEVAEEKYYSIDYGKVINEEQFDGFYAVTTDLEDNDLSLILKANRQRWEIEESFMIMKSELKTRPMYVTREASIGAHLLTCFVALLVYRILEKYYLDEAFTYKEIIGTLRDLEIVHIKGNNCIPAFKRNEIINILIKKFGFDPTTEVITQKKLKKFVKVVKSKKSTKL